VNGLRANVKKGGFDWFLNESPDIYCIQETKVKSEQLESGIANPPGYFAYYDHSKMRSGWSGVASFTKIKPEKVTYGIGQHKYDQEGRFIGLFFNNLIKDIPKLAVLNIYFPNGGGGPERLQFKLEYYEEFLKHINDLKNQGYEVLFTGDVNTAHEAIDLARPKDNEDRTGFLPIERAWMDKLVENGYVDVFRTTHPDETGKYTYWDMKTFARERNVGWRIDYFFVTPKLMGKVEKTRILDNILGSDHCPIDIFLG
jgi:exodeoxyribonuclease-3